MKKDNKKNEKKPMDVVDATMICDGGMEADENTTLEAWALLIKNGMVWSLQGFYGRTATDLINRGIISKEGKILQRPASVN